MPIVTKIDPRKYNLKFGRLGVCISRGISNIPRLPSKVFASAKHNTGRGDDLST